MDRYKKLAYRWIPYDMQMVVWGAVSRNLHDTSRNLLGISLVTYKKVSSQNVFFRRDQITTLRCQTVQIIHDTEE